MAFTIQENLNGFLNATDGVVGSLTPTQTATEILPDQTGHAGEVLSTDGADNLSWIATGGGSGTVTSVSVTTANGISGSVATATTTPAITLTLGAITPTSVAASGAVSGSNLSGTNTGDQTITLSGDVTGSGTSSFVTAIGANKVLTANILDANVTLAKIANIGTDRVLGRDTAASGVTEELTVGGGIEFTGAGGIQTSAFTGDVTKTAGGTATTIANDAVTYAKIQNVTTNKLLGRASGGAGDVEEITLGTGLAYTGTTLNVIAGAGSVTDFIFTNGGGFTGIVGTSTTTPTLSLTLDNGGVALGKIANIADLTILGNNTGGAAAPLALTAAQTKTVLSLNNVENTALSTWAGSGNITTVGTIASGVWMGTDVAVSDGGTGRSTLTDRGVLIGRAVAAIDQTSAGTSGQILLSGGSGANPDWSTATFPSTAGTAGSILTSDGTNWASAFGGWTTVKVSGSNFTTSSLSLVGITGLSFSAVASTRYEIEVMLYCNSSSTAGGQFGANSSGGSPTVILIQNANGNATTQISAGIKANNTAMTACLTTAADGVVCIKGVISSGTGSPTISIRGLKVTSGTLTVYIGSYLQYRILA